MAAIAMQVEADLRELATGAVKRAMELGASAAEAVVSEGSEFSTVVRLGAVETLKEAGSRSMGVRVFCGARTANTSSSDLSAEGVEHLVRGAIELAKITSEDTFAGLPAPESLGQLSGELALY